MHEAVRQFVRAHLPARYSSVLEVGSLDINGGVRDLLDPEAEYTGVDVQPGPGVDAVHDFAIYDHRAPVDVVLCLEVLEHALDWEEIVASAAENLRSDGLLLVTCATTGRRPHSARSEGAIEPDEHYRNILKRELDTELAQHFATFQSEVIGTDLRAWAAKGTPRWVAIIPTRNPENLKSCADSLRAIQPNMTADQVVVISDSVSLEGATWVRGREPFVFAEAINAGARAAGDADLLICGDDVRFLMHGTVDRLQSRSEGCAAIVPEVVGVCGQSAQRVGSEAVTAQWLAFICIYIPRRVWDAVGGLDERFIGYGCDDVDWCLRARRHGQLFVDHGCRVEHADCSTYRNRPDWQALYAHNAKLFDQKWRATA